MLGRRASATAYAGDASLQDEDREPRRWRRGNSARRPPEGAVVARRTLGGLSALFVRLIMFVTGVVALIIALGIAVVVLRANPGNTIVSHVHSWARTLTGPFDGMFSLGSTRATVALNWGIALIVYLAVARLITSPLRGAAWWGSRGRRVPG